ncbi:hypothetical protein OROHE_009535 [Orobanche hederae]
MRTSMSSLMSKLRPTSSSKGRLVGTMTPRKQTNNSTSEAHIEKEKVEPIAAFSRPPPLSPFLGPLVALSILESWNNTDNNSND